MLYFIEKIVKGKYFKFLGYTIFKKIFIIIISAFHLFRK